MSNDSNSVQPPLPTTQVLTPQAISHHDQPGGSAFGGKKKRRRAAGGQVQSGGDAKHASDPSGEHPPAASGDDKHEIDYMA